MATDRLAVRESGWLDAAGSVQQETLLVYGADDQVATSRDADWFEHHLRRSSRVTVPDAGRLVLLRAWPNILSFIGSEEPQS
jgi:pimeloyl-ACP methyl ester carboxylesterase